MISPTSRPDVQSNPTASDQPTRVRGKRGRPRLVDLELQGDTRELLIQATSDLMTEKNSTDISLNEVAEATGKTPALIAYHFSNKEGLLMAVLEREAARAVSQLAELAASALSAEKMMRMHIGGLINAYYRTPYANRLMNELMQNASESTSSRVSEIFLEPIAKFHRDLLARGLEDGVFCKVDPVDFYFILVGACDHFFARRSVLKDIFGIDAIDESIKSRYSRSLVAIIMAGISVDASR